MRQKTAPPIRVALIGAGVMGTHHARVIAASDRAELAIVVDSDVDRARKVTDAHGGTYAADVDVVAACDAGVVAAPTDQHEAITRFLLDRGVPVLVEKPITTDLETTRDLISLAEQRDVPMMCGFIERFNPVVTTAKQLLEEPVVHMVALRHSPPNLRIESSVVHDLLIHDLDLALAVCGDAVPCDVRAVGWAPKARPLEVVDTVIKFDGGLIVNASADRWGQRKVRSISMSTSRRLLELDLVRQTLTAYQHVEHSVLADAGYRAETVVDVPFIRHAGEPLALQFDHFLDLVRGTADASEERATLLGPHELAAAVESSMTS